MREICMLFERSLVYPMRVKVKEPLVPDRAKAVDFQAPRFLAGRDNNLSHCVPQCVFAACMRVEATKDE
jgi:hypothetical protein